MALTFRTTYETYFRKHPIKTRTLKRPAYDEFSILPEGGKWLDTTLHIEDSLDEAKAIVSDMYKKRYVTSYQKHYCKRFQKKSLEGKENDHQFLDLVGTIYKTNDKAVLPPLNSARRVLGYMNPILFHINMSAYQDEIGRAGYKILERGARKVEKPELVVGTTKSEPNVPQQSLEEKKAHDSRPSSTKHCICYCY